MVGISNHILGPGENASPLEWAEFNSRPLRSFALEIRPRRVVARVDDYVASVTRYAQPGVEETKAFRKGAMEKTRRARQNARRRLGRAEARGDWATVAALSKVVTELGGE